MTHTPLLTAEYLRSQHIRRYALGMLTLTYTLNFIDRQILSILVEPIKRDLAISDTQMGLLTGLAFALFYTALGIPLGRLAERVNRRSLIAVALATWSVFTALQGLAQSYWQLLLFRIGVGVGEAGCSPPAHSIIADYYPAAQRATALGIYALGIPFGILFGFLLGGWIEQFFGWRVALIMVGLPGLAVALLVRLTVHEPPRGQSDQRQADSETMPTLVETLRFLRRQKALVHLSLGAALASLVGYAMLAWIAAFMARSHGMSSGELGTWLGLIYGIAGGIGMFTGGKLADHLGAIHARWYLGVAAIALLLTVPFALLVFTADSVYAALAGLAGFALLSNGYQATAFAQTQTLAGLRMRATAAAMLIFIMNLVGLGLGPTAVGILSDLLTPQFAADGLRWALLLCSLINLWAAAHFVLASRHFPRELAGRTS
jgi:predicted MFS family arabinose efflux permease